MESSKIQKLTKIFGGNRSDHSFFTLKYLTKLTTNISHTIYSWFLMQYYLAKTRLRKHENLPKHPGQQAVSLPFFYFKKLYWIDSLPHQIYEQFFVWFLEIPTGMKVNPQCGKGVVWDDFDKFLETITGKETLCNTYGINYYRRRINWSRTWWMRIFHLRKKHV